MNENSPPQHDGLITVAYPAFATVTSPNDASINSKYRPFLFDPRVGKTDWIRRLELDTVETMANDGFLRTGTRLRILVIYGSLSKRYHEFNVRFKAVVPTAFPSSFSKLLAYEAARILYSLSCDVRVFDPLGLPVKDGEQEKHLKVVEITELVLWSDGHFWVSPEQHGNLTAVFKNQIDWIHLNTGSVRPTHGRTIGIAMVSGGLQSFNTVNSLRLLGRWMRMFTIPNQASVPKAYEKFTAEDAPEGGSRLIPGSNRDRVVVCVEEMVKYTIIMRNHSHFFNDRFRERRAAEEDDIQRTDAANGKNIVNGVNIKAL